jgi:type VI secretion system protein VasJ
MSDEPNAAIVALGKDPINESSAVGDPVRYEETFEQLQGQMDRIGSLTGEAPEWNKVVELATDILKTKSKDLLVMTYLTIGLFESQGYSGLAAAFTCYREFIKNFWEKCYPKVKPPHGRLNAIQYLADKILPQVELSGGQAPRAPRPDEKEAVHKCVDELTEFDSAVTEAFSTQPETPNLLPFLRAFKALKQKVGPLASEAPPAPAEAGGVAAEGGASQAAATTAAAVGGGVPDSFTSPTQAQQSIIKIAKYFLSQNNKDARGYRLMRAAHFGALLQAPKDNLVPGPPAPRRQFFEKTAADGDWPTLMTEAEGQFAVTPLWLDMQRYVAMAAKNQGPAFKAVHDAVAFEAVALRGRLPELFNVTFKDGTGFSDGLTQSWLDEVGGEFGGGGGGGGGGDDAVSKAIGEARKLLGAAKGPEAIGCISAAIENSGSRRQRFRAQLALAGFCLDLKKLTLAASVLEGLEQAIDEYRLEEWEPELAARAMGDLFSCLKKLKPKPTPEDLKRSAEVFARLCRLDPGAALKLDSAG